MAKRRDHHVYPYFNANGPGLPRLPRLPHSIDYNYYGVIVASLRPTLPATISPRGTPRQFPLIYWIRKGKLKIALT